MAGYCGDESAALRANVEASEAAPSDRDMVVHDELFHSGAFSDVVFKFRIAGSVEIEKVYGQGSLFALLSPVLQRLLSAAPAPAEGMNESVTSVEDLHQSQFELQQHLHHLQQQQLLRESKEQLQQQLHQMERQVWDLQQMERQAREVNEHRPERQPEWQALAVGGVAGDAGRTRTWRKELWLEESVASARGFREVARYVYHLAPSFSAQALPEIVHASRRLQLPELERMALRWGHEDLALRAAALASGAPTDASRAAGRIDDALRVIDELCTLQEPGEPGIEACWREAMLRAYDSEEVLDSLAFLKLAPKALQVLLGGYAMQKDPGALWCACLAWARARALRLGFPTDASSSRPSASPLRPIARGARLAVPPPPPAPAAVEWQRCLLPVAATIHFALLSPAEFAKHVEELDPMLPELRQVIYAARRHNLREAPPAPPLPPPTAPPTAPPALLALADGPAW